MGIGYHGFQFLRVAAKYGCFGRVATIGRQGLFLEDTEVRNLMGLGAEYEHGRYCEHLLLKYFGASCVDSWDYSGYEGASHIADMNKPFRDAPPAYDTVIDAGSLEHIYNAPQALSNVSELCREGGQILHILPANNFCGHGFWQFSPELFFSLYCESNGYAETRVFLASEYRTDVWYEVAKPDGGQRANVISFTPVFVLCRTVKARKPCHHNVQQSDYMHVWQRDVSIQPKVNERPKWRAKIRSALQRSALVDFAYMLYIELSGGRSLSPRNPHLTVRSVVSEVANPSRSHYSVLGVRVDVAQIPDVIARMEEWIARREKCRYVAVTGMHGVTEAQHDGKFRKMMNAADLVVADGYPLAWLGRRKGFAQMKRRVYGPELMEAFCERTAGKGYRHFFYGGAPGVAEELARRFAASYKGLEVAGIFCPPFRALTAQEDGEVVEAIERARPDIVWVGLSTPKQERWMFEHRNKLCAPVLVGVGAAFDFHTGRAAQAPRWMREHGLEWLFRLMQEPRRLWRRYLVYGAEFAVLVLLELLGLKKAR